MTEDPWLDRRSRRGDPTAWSATSGRGMIASAHYLATRAGAEVLEGGGTAVDAAIATSLALAVVEPAGSGIGGMAMMLVKPAGGRAVVLSGPCRAPRNATPAAVAASPRYSGYRAVATPGYISVIEAAHRRWGTIALADLVAPAIRLAERGFAVTPLQAELWTSYADKLAGTVAGEYFVDPSGRPLKIGARLVQPVLARTLRRLSDAGLRDFYEGDIAAAIAEDMRRGDGFVDRADLAAVQPPEPVAPLEGQFAGQRVWTTGAPAGGATLLQMLHTLEQLAPGGVDLDTPTGASMVAAVIQRARADRRQHRLDPDLELHGAERSRAVASELRESIGLGETSHLSAMDAHGNAVGLTQSIERSFGSRVVTPELGFLHNGYMKGFKIEATGHPHYLRPGAVARSNAAPTILAVPDGPAVVIGSTGSERMVSSIFTTLLRLRRHRPFASVHAPRLHVTPEGIALLEAERWSPEVVAALRRSGLQLQDVGPFSFKFGGLHCVVRCEQTLTGVAEPRRDGAAAGPPDAER